MTITNNGDKTKLVIIRGSGNIRELGNICAPILTPQRIDVGTIAKIVSGGRVVFEVNPENRNEMVKLTLSNVRSENFKSAEAPVPAKAETPAPTVSATAKKDEKKEPAKPAATTTKAADTTKTASTPASDFAAK